MSTSSFTAIAAVFAGVTVVVAVHTAQGSYLSTHRGMPNNVLPAVRVPTVPGNEQGSGVSETPIVDLPPSEKFGFAWPDRAPPMSASIMPVSSAEQDSSELETSEAESQASKDSASAIGERDYGDHTPMNEIPTPNTVQIPSPSPPRLSRAFSMPLPSQLGHLKNPHRLSPESPPSPLTLMQQPKAVRFQELSLELADSVQMVIQTLLQISPPHLLDPAKEQFSACSLSVPSPSISAMLTAMKNLNYMSANMSTFADDSRLLPAARSSEHNLRSPELPIYEDFDIGEMLQSVGDALSGLASQAGVELVLFHADVGMKHVSVHGDECGISYALSHIIRQVLDTAQRGDTLEIGLFITAETIKQKEKRESQDVQKSGEESHSPSRTSSSTPDFDGPLWCTFDVGHKFAAPDSIPVMEGSPRVVAGTSLFRAKPALDTIFFRRLLVQLSGTIKEDLQPRLFSPGRSCEFSLALEAGSAELLTRPPNHSAEEEAVRQPYANANIRLASEPSLEELFQFAETMKGKKVALHASAKGSFAHHLTSYLTAWGLDVSHMSASVFEVSSASEDAMDTHSPGSKDDGYRVSPPMPMTESPGSTESPVEDQLNEKAVDSNPAFILIDDDVVALRSRLVQLRSEPPFNLHINQRPRLSSYHRPKSSPQIYRAKGVKPSFTGAAVASLSPFPGNYIPEIIVLPKPAGPRRLLTALRTAIVKPIVDPFFSPIATSPLSPNGLGANPFSPFFGNPSPSQKSNRTPVSPRTNSDRSSRSSKDAVEFVPRLPPSPLRETDSMEYFSEAAAKLGTSPSSGLVIQSPDGQPAGIFFHPRGSGTKLHRPDSGPSSPNTVVSPPNLVRDAGNLKPPEHRRSALLRRASPGDSTAVPGDRTKSSRPTMLKRNRSGRAYFDRDTPTEASSGQRWAQTAVSLSEDAGGHRAASAVPAAVLPEDVPSAVQTPQTIAGDARKSGSPPSSPLNRMSPGTPGSLRRSFTRRGTAESATAPAAVDLEKRETERGWQYRASHNPINQTILSTFMKKKKIKYDVAKNGAEAVAKWKTGGFHLILMDIQMPVMDGIEATKEIRRLERQTATGVFPSTPPVDGEQTPSDAPSIDSKSSLQTPFRSAVIIVALTASSLPTDRIIEWGSIKALQMWADLRPEVMKNISSGQLSQAKHIASKLYVPENRKAARAAPSSSAPKSDVAGASQIDVMRKLSSPARTVALARDLDHTESEQSDTEPRATALDTAVTTKIIPPTPTTNAEGGSRSHTPSGTQSVRAQTPLEDKSLLSPSVHLSESREVSGEEALLAHMKDSAIDASSVAELTALDRPVVIGERAISSSARSIAEVMYGDAAPPQEDRDVSDAVGDPPQPPKDQ
ncbi:hypothetical protein DFH11DRAFT_1735128 [Phellopilus nigrolimitatus]|nr:hypothetical protein DFH11DRAFT_1735128 [Phellopilus nigrolimitatus]